MQNPEYLKVRCQITPAIEDAESFRAIVNIARRAWSDHTGVPLVPTPAQSLHDVHTKSKREHGQTRPATGEVLPAAHAVQTLTQW